jgi:crossover junction endodeoxyribonuclease RusA
VNDVTSQHWTLLQLPWPPTINHYYGTTRGGKRYLTPQAKAYREEVCLMLRRRSEPFQGPVAVSIVARPPNRLVRDLDNLLKALLDAITHSGAAWVDDSQIHRLEIAWGEIVPKGRVFVEVSECDDLREQQTELPLND